MKNIEDIFSETGIDNMDSLSAYITNIREKNAESAQRITELESEVDQVKKEKTVAKTEATKSKNQLKKLEEEVQLLKDELENQSEIIQSLKEAAEVKKKDLMPKKELKNKADLVMKQEGVEECFISLKGEVFLNETVAFNSCGTKYKIARMVDGQVQLTNPKK